MLTLKSLLVFFLVLAFFAGVYAFFKMQAQSKVTARQKIKLIKKQQEEEKRQQDLRKPAEVIATTNPLPLHAPKRGRVSLILLVEDSPTMLLTLRKILERWNYKVITASDGRQAWTQLQKNKPDLVVSDIDMPHLNGLELLQLIRNDILFMNIPVILITGNATMHFQATQQAGVNGLLAKPFEDRALIDQVRYLLQE